VGEELGEIDGMGDGCLVCDGGSVGDKVGAVVGSVDCFFTDGNSVGAVVGKIDGHRVGAVLGKIDGDMV